jgi:hypothetical protein
MRINFLHSMFLAPALLVAAALTAQPTLAESHVNVPFNFVVAGTACNAGMYTVTEENTGTTLRLSGATQSFVWIAGPGASSLSKQRAILTFDRVGSTHMLRTVEYGTLITAPLDHKTKESIPVPEQVMGGQ